MLLDGFTVDSQEIAWGTIGDHCTWEIMGDVLTISGEGAMWDLTEKVHAEYFDYDFNRVVILDGVTSIGDYVFHKGRGITSIEIADSVINIGEGAFYGCSGLTSIAIPDGVTSIRRDTFYGCSGLTGIEIADSVTNIGDSAFYGCSGITSIEIPESVTNIGDSAFYGCSRITSIEIPESVTNISDSAFYGCSGLTSIEIADSVTNIGNSAFYGCSGVTSIEIPEGVTNISDSAFCECSGLTSIEIPDSVTSISDFAFDGCSGLTSIEIPDSVINIGCHAFFRCSGITSIKIPFVGGSATTDQYLGYIFGATQAAWNRDYVPKNLRRVEISDICTNIGSGAFYGCSWITSIEIPDGVTSIGDSAFWRCRGLTSIEIPDGVTKIGNSVFYGCSGLTSIEIPDGVTSIGASAFYECSGLTSIEIPDGVTSIDDFAFRLCSGITSIEVPDGVTIIGASAFSSCYALTSIVIPDSVTSIRANAFIGSNKLEEVWYGGSESDKESIKIGENNTSLENAFWHINTCKEEHIYSNNCDSTCDECDWTRLQNPHNFCMNNGLTCEYCGYSQQPDKPILDGIMSETISLVCIEGFEYSKDGENWQDSNVFTGLSENTTYTFYQRVKESSVAMTSEKSDGLSVYLKYSQAKPSVPIIADCTETTITLIPISNGEYSLDNVNWQQSYVFSGLLPGTEYTIYQRCAETSTHFVSETSEVLIVKTVEQPAYILGDVNNDNEITDADALYLLYHTIFGESYPIEQHCDYNNDGAVTDADALYLLYHTIFGDSYPLNYK